MTQLINIRRRIRAIETIKKVTHAMRLISMSAHTKLHERKTGLQRYQKEITTLFDQVSANAPEHYTIINAQKENLPLFILIGSQKGLCGNFNTRLFDIFSKIIEKFDTKISVIAIGKKVTEYVDKLETVSVFARYPSLHYGGINSISQKVTDSILKKVKPFSTVTVVSNKLQNFFIQKPHSSKLIPSPSPFKENKYDDSEYHWEHTPTKLLTYLSHKSLTIRIQSLLLDSITAEQAARFISMDRATRNAETLLEMTTHHYHKLRQTQITKEVSELSGGILTIIS